MIIYFREENARVMAKVNNSIGGQFVESSVEPDDFFKKRNKKLRVAAERYIKNYRTDEMKLKYIKAIAGILRTQDFTVADTDDYEGGDEY